MFETCFKQLALTLITAGLRVVESSTTSGEYIFCYFVLQSKLRGWWLTEFKERMNDVKSELASYDAENQDDTHRAKASVALKRIDEWNLFSDSSEVLIVIFVWLKISMPDNIIF